MSLLCESKEKNATPHAIPENSWVMLSAVGHDTVEQRRKEQRFLINLLLGFG